MNRFELGPGLACELEALLNTRLLVQANSGGGKSWLLRRLLEQTHGKVQHLVIDPEGEFATLRERFDYVLAAREDGDTVADPRSAKLLAERLLELGASAILDIYELKAHERVLFVRRFLDALVNAPKRLWHPVLVVIDEAHVYAPQVGEAESRSAVIDLCTRGRKRGFAAVLATQRLSKLHKDAAAECNNKLIGRTSLDVDMARAGDELGLRTKDQAATLRTLENGQFYAFGPAFSTREVTRVTIGRVQTTHPKAGSRLAAPTPAPSAKVKALLSKLADLPAEAEARERSIETLTRDLAAKDRELKRLQAEASQQARNIPSAMPENTPERIPVLTDADRALLETLASEIRAGSVQTGAAAGEFLGRLLEGRIRETVEDVVGKVIDRAVGLESKRQQDFEKRLESKGLAKVLEKLYRVAAPPAVSPRADVRTNQSAALPLASMPATVHRGSAPKSADRPPAGVAPVQQRILDAVAELEQLGSTQPARELVAMLAGYTHLQSKGFVNAMSALRTGGLLDYPPGGGTVALTDQGRAAASPPERPRSPRELQDRVVALLGGASGRILEPLIHAYPDALARQDVAAAAGYGHLQSKGFVNALSRLRTLGFVDYPDRGSVVAKPVLFLEG